MYTSAVTLDTVSEGEFCVDMSPKFFTRQNSGSVIPQPGVSWVHGAGSNGTYCLDEYGKQSDRVNAIASVYPAVSGDNGGPQTWGNQDSVDGLTRYISRLAGRLDVTDDYALIGDSMGGIVSLNYAAQAIKKPNCIVLTIPVININDIVTNDRGGYAGLINAAYSGGYSESVYGQNYNPYTMRNMEKLKNIPMLIFYGLQDTLCLPSFVSEFVSADPAFRTGVSLNFGHTENMYSAVNSGANLQMMVDFLDTHLG